MQSLKQKQYLQEYYIRNKEILKERSREWNKNNKTKKQETGKKYYLNVRQPKETQGLTCQKCQKTFTSLKGRATHERYHNQKYIQQAQQKVIKMHERKKELGLEMPTNNQMPKTKDYSTRQEYRKAYKKAYKQIFSERKQTQDKNYKDKPSTKEKIINYRLGKIDTKTILSLTKYYDEIKRLYLIENMDYLSISKKYNVSTGIIQAIIKKLNVNPRKPLYMSKNSIFCSNGLRVKSNNERNIAEYLLKNGIEFQYEPILKNDKIVYKPDFYLIKQNLYIEMAGLLKYDWYKRLTASRVRFMKSKNLNYIVISDANKIGEIL